MQHRRHRHSIAVLGAFALTLAVAPDAWAGCCRLVKIDDSTPVVPVRACESGAGDACTTPSFEQTLEIGAYHDVCVSTESLVYQEWDPQAAAFSPGIEAACDGGDVEI
jgi:hypothetical protein